MKIKLIPEARNEEKIAEIKKALETLEDDALEEYLDGKVCEGEEWFDAMYYASEQGDSILATWEEYFHERLLDDEKHYFAAAIGDYDF